MIPRIDACSLRAGDPLTLDALRVAAQEIGFLVLTGTALDAARVTAVIAAYRDFFRRPEAEKRAVDMARTGSNRGWGAAQSEQVDPGANPDYKQVFDCGFELAAGDPLRGLDLPVYADNLWPARPARRNRAARPRPARARRSTRASSTARHSRASATSPPSRPPPNRLQKPRTPTRSRARPPPLPRQPM